LSEFFNVPRDFRQQDPLSPYICLICAEILGILVQKSREIKGLTTDIILSAIQLETNLNVEFKRVIGRQFLKNYFDLPSFWDTSDHSLSLCDRHVSLLISMINRSEDKFAHINPEKFKEFSCKAI
jgi:hypothetical protein